MKILYAIQGTGNGHIARAMEVIPVLKKFGKVDIFLSGNQCEINLPWDVKYRYHGASFVFGKKGGIDLKSTFKNISLVNFIAEVCRISVREYDLVLNDFEPVVAWACKLKGKECIGISHQSAVLHHKAPQPRGKSLLGKSILKYYAPTHKNYGFHFEALGDGFFTPVIRKDIRFAQAFSGEHYTVYLPSYSDEAILDFLTEYPQVKWEVFSKHNTRPYSYKNVYIQPVDKVGFAKSMLASKGVLCNAGFETPAEALYLKKKLCVLPMRGQYEQQCNAAMLASMGIPVFRTLKDVDETMFKEWLTNKKIIEVDYPNDTNWIVSSIVKAHAQKHEETVFAV